MIIPGPRTKGDRGNQTKREIEIIECEFATEFWADLGWGPRLVLMFLLSASRMINKVFRKKISGHMYKNFILLSVTT